MLKKTSINTEKLISSKSIKVSNNTNKILFHNSGNDSVQILDVVTIPPATWFELKAGENQEFLNLQTISISFLTTAAPALEIIKFELHD